MRRVFLGFLIFDPGRLLRFFTGVMKRFGVALLCLCLAAPLIASADAISGVILRGPLSLSLKDEFGASYKIISRSTDVQRTLKRLETGDSIVSSGRLDTVNKVAEIEAIDFVGLGRIIGLWNTQGAKSMMQFRSFSDVNVYSFVLQSNGNNVVRNRKNFKYTLSPANDSEWVMFLSDDQSTQMGFLKLGETDATLSLLNSQTGEVQNVLQMRKVGL